MIQFREKFCAFRRRRAVKKVLSVIKSLRHADDDVLTEPQKKQLDALIADGKEALNGGSGVFLSVWQERMRAAVPPKRFAAVREYLDILLVAGAVAFGIRGLFLQPFRIPTSSMQPTLYGIHYVEKDAPGNTVLGRFTSAGDLLLGSARRAECTVKENGSVDLYSMQSAGNMLFDSTSFSIAGRRYTLPGAPEKVCEYAGLKPYVNYEKGSKLCDGYLSLGDHLFVERLSVYLSPLKRGDVIVFTTDDLICNNQKLSDISGAYYIKRLAGLPGDTLKIEPDGLYIRPKGEKEFRHAAEFSEKLGKLYSGLGGYQKHSPFTDSGSGNYLHNYGVEYVVPESSYFVLGDNVAYSMDGRFFGAVPRKNIVGRAWLVFWPFSRRFGIADSKEPLNVPTGASRNRTFPSMYLQ